MSGARYSSDLMPTLRGANQMDEPRKVNPDAVEIIGAQGEVVQEAKEKAAPIFGNVKVIQGGPWMLLLIPVALVVFFMVAILALLFGRSVFKMAARGMRRQ